MFITNVITIFFEGHTVLPIFSINNLQFCLNFNSNFSRKIFIHKQVYFVGRKIMTKLNNFQLLK